VTEFTNGEIFHIGFPDQLVLLDLAEPQVQAEHQVQADLLEQAEHQVHPVLTEPLEQAGLTEPLEQAGLQGQQDLVG